LSQADDTWECAIALDGFKRPLGCIVIRSQEPFSSLKLQTLLLHCQYLTMAYDFFSLQKQQQQQLEATSTLYDLYQDALNQAFRDRQTGLANKADFLQRIGKYVEESKRHTFPLSLLMLDLDHFKELNDRFGHQAGDYVLSCVGALISDSIRASDYAARFGGEEFAIVLPNTNENQAIVLAERIRRRLQKERFEYAHFSLKTTVSIGISELSTIMNEAKHLIEAADQRLYHAKQSGRNRTCIADRPIDVQVECLRSEAP
jgi:diguanylate cyclase (GGDEF)-like protein